MRTTVKDVMTTRVIWVKKDATFREMAVALREHRVSAFPVVDDDGAVIGVVSEADMLTKEALDDEPVDPQALQVTVSDGVVTLAGRPETRDTGHEIVRRVRHVQGVVAVRDRLDYPPVERPGDRYDTLANFPMD
jgi:CBS-domain-containing membrane protein